MYIKKSGKRIFGASFSNAEKKAMEMEIKRQLAEYDRKHTLEIDAMILWTLHEQFGFGEKRLKRFYDSFARGLNELSGRYELDDSDQAWLCVLIS